MGKMTVKFPDKRNTGDLEFNQTQRIILHPGLAQTLRDLQNENGHGKVKEHENKFAKS